jgi:Ca2+-transporting ATPase
MSKAPSKPDIDKPWSRPFKEIIEELNVSPSQGLDEQEVENRRRKYGSNKLQSVRKKSVWRILLDQFKSLIILLLAVASAVSFAFGQWIEGIAIGVAIIINAGIGFFTELKAIRSMEALRRLGGVTVKVLRGGRVSQIPAQDLVPGDIVILEGGDLVAADVRLIEASKLQTDESTLTGESLPVSKSTEPLEQDVPLAERSSMSFKGTAVTRGSGRGVVVATGMHTELGEISSLVDEAEEEITPLEKRLNQLGHKLIWATLVIAALVAAAGILSGKELFLMIETSIALAVAAIPEGLPVVATIALARGMWRMAKRNALINRLAAVETLGATSVIFSDKTGTLTENRMTVTLLALDSNEIEIDGDKSKSEKGFFSDGQPVDPTEHQTLRRALEAGVLCNNASLESDNSEGENKGVGDPMEIALLAAGIKAGIKREKLTAELPEEREEAFDPEVKMMATFHRDKEGYRVAVKGAPEPVLEASASILAEQEEKKIQDEDRKRWLERNQEYARGGLRVLALAEKRVDSTEVDPYKGLTFLGLVGLLDPPRQEVSQAIEECRQAGIKVIMVTGDQPVTALNIGSELSLADSHTTDVIHGNDLKRADQLSGEERQHILQAPIFARVSPKQKLDLIEIHQKNGSVVAMTGDGVNDAPALKKADIGIAMGRRGTEVAREASDMVLKDDSFSTIAAAVAQGRVIFGNIRKFVFYLISCNVSEIMIVALGSVMRTPLPILPLQILFLNLITDVFPALALGVGEGDPSIMKRKPRDPEEPILSGKHWLSIAGYSATITIAVLGALVLAINGLHMEERQAVTVSFLTLAFAQLWHVFNMRDPGTDFFRNEVTQNRYVWGALALCTALLLIAVYLPILSGVLKIKHPGAKGWLVVLVMSLIPWAVGQVAKSIGRKDSRA